MNDKTTIVISSKRQFASIERTLGLKPATLQMLFKDKISDLKKILSNPQIEDFFKAMELIGAVITIENIPTEVSFSRLEVELLGILSIEKMFKSQDYVLGILNANESNVSKRKQEPDLKITIERLAKLGLIEKKNEGIPPDIRITQQGKEIQKTVKASAELF